MSFPRWTRSPVSRFVRRVSLPTCLLPAIGSSMQLRVEGLEHVTRLDAPVLFAANHQSHMDTPAIYRALPAHVRDRIAPAMAKEFFAAHFGLRPAPVARRLINRVAYYLACQCFNAFPIPQQESVRGALRYMRELNADGYSILIYPEGRRSERGEILPFRRGVGLIAIHLGLSVVPVRIEGLDRVFPPKARIPVRGPVRVAFGPPLQPEGDDSAGFTARIEAAVHALGPRLAPR